MMTNSIKKTYPGANALAFVWLASAPFVGGRRAAGASPSQGVVGRAPWCDERLEGGPGRGRLNGRIFHNQI
jgi:hypothetical protein